MRRTILKTVLSLCSPFLVLVAACGTGPAAEGPASSQRANTTTVASSKAPTTVESTGSASYDTEAFFPKLKRSEPTPLVVAKGEFFLDDEGCLRVDDVWAKGEMGFVPLWTPQYELDTRGEEIRVLDRQGLVAARVGKGVVMGGGAIGRKTLEEHGFLDERTLQELFDRCSGNDYWIVADGDVHLISQG